MSVLSACFSNNNNNSNNDNDNDNSSNSKSTSKSKSKSKRSSNSNSNSNSSRNSNIFTFDVPDRLFRTRDEHAGEATVAGAANGNEGMRDEHAGGNESQDAEVRVEYDRDEHVRRHHHLASDGGGVSDGGVGDGGVGNEVVGDELRDLDLELVEMVLRMVRIAEQNSNSSVSVDFPLLCQTFTKVATLMSETADTSTETSTPEPPRMPSKTTNSRTRWWRRAAGVCRKTLSRRQSRISERHTLR